MSTTTRSNDPTISTGTVLAESGISTLLVIIFLVFIACIAAVIYFIRKKRQYVFSKVGFPAIAIGIGVIIAVIFIFIICWYRGKRAKNCATLYGKSPIDPNFGPVVITTASRYSITSDITADNASHHKIDDTYKNDLIGINFNFPTLPTTFSPELTSPALTMGNYYGKTIIIAGIDPAINLSTATSATVTFVHGTTSYQQQVPIIVKPIHNVAVIKIPTFGYSS